MATNPIQAMIASILAGETQSEQKKTSISELPATDTLKDTDVIPVVQDDQTKKVTCEVLKRLLGGSISDEQIQNAVDAYLTEHPVQAGATAEQAAQIEENKNDISELSEEFDSLEIADVTGLQTALDNGKNFVVNVTMAETTTADKTYDEIVEAYNSGRNVIAALGAMTLPLLDFESSGVAFCTTAVGEDVDNWCITSVVVIISNDNSVSFSTHLIDKFSGATSSASGYGGLVPAPAAGDQDKFLKGDGTWGIPTDTTLPIATSETLGGVKPVAKTDAMTQSVGVDANGALYTASGGSTESTIIFDSGEITEEANLIGPINVSGYSKIRILGKAYPSANSAGKRAAMLCFEGSATKKILCNTGYNKLFDTAGNPVAFVIYVDKGAGAWTTETYSGFNASNVFDSTKAYLASSMATSADGSSLIYTNLYNEEQMYICAQDDFSTRPWGVGTRIMVVGDI